MLSSLYEFRRTQQLTPVEPHRKLRQWVVVWVFIYVCLPYCSILTSSSSHMLTNHFLISHNIQASPTRSPVAESSAGTQKPTTGPTTTTPVPIPGGTQEPSVSPSTAPTTAPSQSPSKNPSKEPSVSPSKEVNIFHGCCVSQDINTSLMHMLYVSNLNSFSFTLQPTSNPSLSPSKSPSKTPSSQPSAAPTALPSKEVRFCCCSSEWIYYLSLDLTIPCYRSRHLKHTLTLLFSLHIWFVSQPTSSPSLFPSRSPSDGTCAVTATNNGSGCQGINNKPYCCKRDNGNGNGDHDKCTTSGGVSSCKKGIASPNTCEQLPNSAANATPPKGPNGNACTGSDICCVQITSGNKGNTFGTCVSVETCNTLVPTCDLAAAGDTCSGNSDCCSGNCKNSKCKK